MAKLEKTVSGEFGAVVRKIENGVMNGSVSASLEDSCDWRTPEAKCAVRVFERYSYAGNNRVSMSVTVFQAGNGPVRVCAITSGGSQAMFFKVNTWGEEAFLDTLRDIL